MKATAVTKVDKVASIASPVYRLWCETLLREYECFVTSAHRLSAYTDLAGLKDEISPLMNSLKSRLDREVEHQESQQPLLLLAPQSERHVLANSSSSSPSFQVTSWTGGISGKDLNLSWQEKHPCQMQRRLPTCSLLWTVKRPSEKLK